MPRPEADLQLERAFASYERAIGTGARADIAAARLSLCLLLERSGWELPREVRDQVWRDRKALRELEQQPSRDTAEAVLRPATHRPPGSPRAVLPYSAAG